MMLHDLEIDIIGALSQPVAVDWAARLPPLGPAPAPHSGHGTPTSVLRTQREERDVLQPSVLSEDEEMLGEDQRITLPMSYQVIPRVQPRKAPSSAMAFGSSVNTLIEVYSNCLSLLKAFGRRGQGAAPRGDGYDRKQVQLRNSLKSDRARVQRAYSAAVSEAGSQFERGDDRARSALSRVLKRMKAAIAKILRPASKHQQPALEYESLILLSNASRSETIKTFDRLSRRLGSTSSRLTVTTTSATPRRRSGHSSSGSTASSKRSDDSRRNGPSASKRAPRRQDAKDRKGPNTDEAKWNKQSKSARPSPSAPHRSLSPKNKPNAADTVLPQHSRTPARSPPAPAAVPNGMSLASIATDSTKLGEIPERKWTSRQTRPRNSDSTLGGSEYYNARPVFPLKAYEAPVKERRFLGLFRRRA